MAHTLKKDRCNEDANPFGLFIEIRSFIHEAYKADKERKLTLANIPLTCRAIPKES